MCLLDDFRHVLDVFRPHSTAPSKNCCTQLLPLLGMCSICLWSDDIIFTIVSCKHAKTAS